MLSLYFFGICLTNNYIVFFFVCLMPVWLFILFYSLVACTNICKVSNIVSLAALTSTRSLYVSPAVYRL